MDAIDPTGLLNTLDHLFITLYYLKMDDKLYFSYKSIHKTVALMAANIEKAGYKPDVIVAIGTGGFIPARILKTFINKPVFTVGLKFYDDNNQPIDRPQKIQWIDEVEKKLIGKSILLVDEIDDTRTTLAYCLRELLRYNPREIAVAVLHMKIKPKRDSFPEGIKHYFVGKEIEDKWTYYPWDAKDIDEYNKIVDE